MKTMARRALGTAAMAATLLLAGLPGGVSGIGTAPAFAQQQAQEPAAEPGTAPGQATRARNSAGMWREIRRGSQGEVSIPDRQAGIMIQSEGDNWRALRNGPVSNWGAWLLAATLVLLTVFLLIRGRIRIESGFSGRLIERFNNLERFAHWLMASSFVVLGLTGLNMLYGRYFLKDLIGGDAFSALTLWGKYVHNFTGFAFMVGLLLTLIVWIRDNIPNRHDLVWIAKAGGMFKRGVHPPSRRFNAGQKLIFWMVVIAGGSLSYTGLSLMFPFTFMPFSGTFAFLNLFGFDLPTALTPMQEMQLTQLWHAILSLVMIAIIFAHIYIGTIGMEGAFDAMGTGYVDENWAREHHNLWVEEIGTARGGGAVHAHGGAHKPDE